MSSSLNFSLLFLVFFISLLFQQFRTYHQNKKQLLNNYYFLICCIANHKSWQIFLKKIFWYRRQTIIILKYQKHWQPSVIEPKQTKIPHQLLYVLLSIFPLYSSQWILCARKSVRYKREHLRYDLSFIFIHFFVIFTAFVIKSCTQDIYTKYLNILIQNFWRLLSVEMITLI